MRKGPVEYWHIGHVTRYRGIFNSSPVNIGSYLQYHLWLNQKYPGDYKNCIVYNVLLYVSNVLLYIWLFYQLENEHKFLHNIVSCKNYFWLENDFQIFHLSPALTYGIRVEMHVYNYWIGTAEEWGWWDNSQSHQPEVRRHSGDIVLRHR